EEIQQLPDRYRAGLVLCHLEGKTQEEAARQLGWSKGTLRRRLGQGRELLRQRLLRRGVAPALALAAVLGDSAAPAAVPAELAATTVQAALGFAAAGAHAAELAEGGLTTMFLGKMKTALTLLLALGVLAGAGLWTHRTAASPEGPPPEKQAA